MEAWDSGSLFQGTWQPHSIVTAHPCLLELASFPPVSVLLVVSPSVRGLEASALSLFAAGEVGMGSGKERGGHLCFQCQEKPRGRLCLLQWHKHLGRVSDHLLSSSSSDASSGSLGLQLGVAVFPMAHLSSSTHSKGEVWGSPWEFGVPSTQRWPPAVAGAEVGHSRGTLCGRASCPGPAGEPGEAGKPGAGLGTAHGRVHPFRSLLQHWEAALDPF